MSIKSKDLVAQVKKNNAANLAAAFKTGDEGKMSEALAVFCGDVQDAILAQAAEEIAMRNQDAAILASRGVHALTNAEMSYYDKLATAMKATDPKMAVENFDVAMPDTVIDGVIGTIKKTHPLLDRVNFRNTAYLTRHVLSNSPADLAKWGKITDVVTKEITGSLKEINVTLCKLSAFMCISQDLIELGPQWMDLYVRETLAESIAMALETAIVTGTGKDEPIGMIRDVSEGASVVGGVYPEQEAVELTELTPVAMGALVAKLARDPHNPQKSRVVPAEDLIFVCNPFDYWGKIFPATCYRKPDGGYIRDVLPVPADIFQSDALASGKAVLGIASKYFLGLGVTGKTGTIVQDDSVRFFEDERAYKAKLHGNGRPMDEYAFLLLDISELKAVVPVLVETVPAEVTAGNAEA